MSETDLKRAVMQILEAHGWLVTRVQAGQIRKGVQLAKAGTADLICCAPNGAYVEIEVKLPTGRIGSLQTKRRDEVERREGYYWIINSTDAAKSLARDYPP